MRMEEFNLSIASDRPPDGINQLLVALWYDKKGDWKTAHEIAQNIHHSLGSWIHAYLHRKEGDIENASYWYGQAGKEIPYISLPEEWNNLAAYFINMENKT